MAVQPWEQVQDPEPGKGMFSSSQLIWSPQHTALVPWRRVKEFTDGEGRKDVNFESSFYKRSSKISDSDLVDWSESITFWCTYGGREDRNVLPAVPPRSGTKPKEGPGSRPRMNKRNFNNHFKRGCECHFIVKRLKDDPDAALITYKHRKHINSKGDQVHGTWDLSLGPAPWGPKLKVAPWLSGEMVKHCEDLLRFGLTVLDVFDIHVESQFSRDAPDRGLNLYERDIQWTHSGRDDLVTKQDLYNMNRRLQEEEFLWDKNDQESVKKWVAVYPERVLVHQEYRQGPPEQEFILGLQAPSQRREMLLYSHESVLALDATFATNKYAFPFFTLVAFDNHQMGVPVAWCVQQTEAEEQITLFLQAVKDQALLVMPTWKPACFVIDCAAAEVKALSIVFPNTPIIFCSWHVRRAWKDNLIKYVPDRTLLLLMNDDLGDIMYAPSEDAMFQLWHAFKLKYHEQKAFITYFEGYWMKKSAKWMRAVREMSRANQNTNGAVEAWHNTFKNVMLRKIGYIGARRLDTLLKVLFQKVYPHFWYKSRLKAQGRIINYKKEEIVLNSLHEAQFSMRNEQVSFPDADLPNQANVSSLKEHGKIHVVRNIFSNFPSCSCKWAQQGNMCKHQLKALLVRGFHDGVLCQQLGSRFGSEVGGISCLEETHSQLDQLALDSHIESLEEGGGDEMCLSQGGGDDSQPVHTTSEEALMLSLSKVHEDMLLTVQGDKDLVEMALHMCEAGLNKLKTKKLQDDFGKNGPQSDTFVRPPGLTQKRQLGVVDLYHGGKRGKRVAGKKASTGVKKNSSQTEKVKEADPLPSMRKLQRETHRQELDRLGQQYSEGRQRRRNAKSTTSERPVPQRLSDLGTGGKVVDLNLDFDLNESPSDV